MNGHVLDNPDAVRPGATLCAAQAAVPATTARGASREIGRAAGAGLRAEKVGSADLAAGDIDNDGDLDLLVTNNGQTAELLRNDGGSGNALARPAASAARAIAAAIGARVRVTTAARTQMRDVKAGSSYLGQNDLRVHVGLGKATRIDRLEVRWPNGQQEMVEGAAVNQILTVTEGKGVTARTPLARK